MDDTSPRHTKQRADRRPSCNHHLCSPQTGMTMIVPLTKHIESLRFPYTCKIAKSQINGLTFDSVALVFHMRSLSNSVARFKEKIGTTEEIHLRQIKILIKDYLSIP
ncbi:MAG: type II toxin-antitoxin system PemK/MazF family toxin [Nitrososphaerota archaeon]|nr:type II toxin-antitoxin system PemK/MazF family toxin [Nitrososphaerota archaeon]